MSTKPPPLPGVPLEPFELPPPPPPPDRRLYVGAILFGALPVLFALLSLVAYVATRDVAALVPAYYLGLPALVLVILAFVAGLCHAIANARADPEGGTRRRAVVGLLVPIVGLLALFAIAAAAAGVLAYDEANPRPVARAAKEYAPLPNEAERRRQSRLYGRKLDGPLVVVANDPSHEASLVIAIESRSLRWSLYRTQLGPPTGPAGRPEWRMTAVESRGRQLTPEEEAEVYDAVTSWSCWRKVPHVRTSEHDAHAFDQPPGFGFRYNHQQAGGTFDAAPPEVRKLYDRLNEWSLATPPSRP